MGVGRGGGAEGHAAQNVTWKERNKNFLALPQMFSAPQNHSLLPGKSLPTYFV